MKEVEYYKNLHVQLSDINRRAAEDPAGFVAACEEGYRAQLEAVAAFAGDEGRYDVLLLAGPTSSGKTTTAHKLSEVFRHRGKMAPVVSLDDFFLGIAQYPRKPDGTPDMESVYALDIPLINRCLLELSQNGTALFPQFDFEQSNRKSEWQRITLEKQDILIVEGLHALNPVLVEALDQGKILKGYVSTRTKFLDGEAEILTPKNMRLIRRMVRDYNFRGHPPLGTISMWDGILEGEEEYIYPFRDNVDFKIDSSLDYEACVFHQYVLPILGPVLEDPLFGEKAREIKAILDAFLDIDHALIPADSLLREFIGN